MQRFIVSATIAAAFALPAQAQQVTFMTGPQGGRGSRWAEP